MAGIAGIDKDFEAARIDGASKIKADYFNYVADASSDCDYYDSDVYRKNFLFGFGLFYQVPMNSGMLFSVTQTIDTYVYRGLMEQGNIGMSSAAGVYQSLVGFILVMLANYIVRKKDPENALF